MALAFGMIAPSFVFCFSLEEKKKITSLDVAGCYLRLRAGVTSTRSLVKSKLKNEYAKRRPFPLASIFHRAVPLRTLRNLPRLSTTERKQDKKKKNSTLQEISPGRTTSRETSSLDHWNRTFSQLVAFSRLAPHLERTAQLGNTRMIAQNTGEREKTTCSDNRTAGTEVHWLRFATS